ncbi:MAG: BolA/IbaG family iron-sulfur metabolism protein [Legionellales bacterium]|nr:BolA/IbaG family iron-sulfur metabolism protein [Legionellales bacterium]
MSDQELHDILAKNFQDGDIDISSDGKHFDVRIVSEKFINLSSLKRQQMVYSFVSEYIRNGYLHALNIRALTVSEWKAQNG